VIHIYFHQNTSR